MVEVIDEVRLDVVGFEAEQSVAECWDRISEIVDEIRGGDQRSMRKAMVVRQDGLESR
jgi:hypothetical protein